MHIKNQIIPFVLVVALLTPLLSAFLAINSPNAYDFIAAIGVCAQGPKNMTTSFLIALMLVGVIPDIKVLILEDQKDG